MLDKVRAMIAADKLEQALDELILTKRGTNDEIAGELAAHQAQLSKIRKESRRGLITTEAENTGRNRIRYAVLEMLNEIEPGERTAEPPKASAGKAPTIFISYNHADSETADKLRAALEQHGIAVRIDRAVMEAGADIQKFIEDSIRHTDATISIVSNRSLLSAWVAMESIYTFHEEKFTSGKRFIACYLDDDFFQNGFRLDATKQIDSKIAEIDELIPQYIAQKFDFQDLNDQRTRLVKLRNDLGDILKRLKSSLCLDIRGDKLAPNVDKIARTILGT